MRPRKPSRATEPSTYAGVAALAQSVAAFLPPEYQPIAHAFTAIAAAVAIRMRESTNKS